MKVGNWEMRIVESITAPDKNASKVQFRELSAFCFENSV